MNAAHYLPDRLSCSAMGDTMLNGTLAWLGRRFRKIYVMQAGSDDYADLAEIHAQCFSRPWSEEDIASFAPANGVQIWMAKFEGRGNCAPAGFVILRNAGGEAEIITVATARRAQRRGVARTLIRHAILELGRDGASRLFLEVEASNQPALRLYRSLGFRQIGRRENYYSARPHHQGLPVERSDALVMELDLR
jgi:[ribosomal protein S18]-alanine N-acetyltransferase